jgi:hypothetical protein
MCVQCMMSAAVSISGASGARLWLSKHVGGIVTPKRLRWITIALFAVAILASGLFVSGSGSGTGT